LDKRLLWNIQMYHLCSTCSLHWLKYVMPTLTSLVHQGKFFMQEQWLLCLHAGSFSKYYTLFRQ
jgi:hypothetical protein